MAVLHYEQRESGEPAMAPFHYRDGTIMHMAVPRFPSYQHPWTRPDEMIGFVSQRVGTRRFEGKLMGAQFWIVDLPSHAMLPQLQELMREHGIPRGVAWEREEMELSFDKVTKYRAEWVEYFELRPDSWQERKAEARELKRKRDQRYRDAARAMRCARNIARRERVSFEFARYEIRRNLTDVPLHVRDWFQAKEREADDPRNNPRHSHYVW